MELRLVSLKGKHSDTANSLISMSQRRRPLKSKQRFWRETKTGTCIFSVQAEDARPAIDRA